MNDKFIEFRKKYPLFIYKAFDYSIGSNLNINYKYIIPGLSEFNHKIIIPKNCIKI